MHLFDANFREMLGGGSIALVGGLFGGALLVAYTNQLFLIPGLLVLLPGFLELRGNISGSFSARLSSGLFLGMVNSHRFKSHVVIENLVASFVLAISALLTLGLLAFAFNYLLLGVVYYEIILIPLLAGILANAVELPLTLFATFYLFNHGHDPSNIMGPFVTTTGDITSILALLLAVMLI
ncbi:MAG: magnesium transporter [Candidatus Diapherotrites archaeon]|nr:magnesium transporter [Candidatus Diapherotrites archaeon]